MLYEDKEGNILLEVEFSQLDENEKNKYSKVLFTDFNTGKGEVA